MSQRTTASDSIHTVILILIAVEIVASVLFLVGYVVPAVISEINHGYLQVSKENRLAQEEHRLQWEAMVDKYFVLRCNTEKAE